MRRRTKNLAARLPRRPSPGGADCDEPTGALESKSGIRVLQVIQQLSRGLATATDVITHNAVIADMADRVIRPADGRVLEVQSNARRRDPAELDG